MNRMRKRWVSVAVAVAVVLAAATTATFLERRGSGRANTRGGTGRAAGTDVFAALRARPLQVPIVPAKRCTPAIDPRVVDVAGLPRPIPAESALGRGPVHPVSRGIPRFLDFFLPERGGPLRRSGWWGNETMWVSEPRYSGPVLVRGGMVHRHARVGFGSRRRPACELRLPAGPWDEARGPVRIWGKRVRPPKNWRVRRAHTRVLAASGRGELCSFSRSTASRSARRCSSARSFSARR
jgi:hypothetical protein